MLHLEFAISPEQIRSVADLSVLEARFGYDKGVLLSRFPKQWFREVSRYLSAHLTDAELDRATEKLRRIQENRLVALGRPFDGKNWAEAATNSHNIQKFHIAIDQALDNLPEFRNTLDELEDQDYQFPTQFSRDAESLARAARALLSNAEKVTLYDPYFCLTKRGYRNTLLSMMNLCQKNNVEFHVFSEEDGKAAWEIRCQALSEFKLGMRDGIKLFWYCADDNGTGFLHSRGIFTAKGGLIYDRGFDEPRDLEQRATRTDISPMPQSMLEKKASSYNTAQQYDDFKLVRNVWASTTFQ